MIRRGYLIFTQGFAPETHKIGLWLYCCLAKQAVQIYYMKQPVTTSPRFTRKRVPAALQRFLTRKRAGTNNCKKHHRVGKRTGELRLRSGTAN